MEGEAKFYGPAIDIKTKDALGRGWQGTTIQVDFNLPNRFDVNYIGEDGAERAGAAELSSGGPHLSARAAGQPDFAGHDAGSG